MIDTSTWSRFRHLLGRAVLLYIVFGVPALVSTKVIGPSAGIPFFLGVILLGSLIAKFGICGWAAVTAFGGLTVFLAGSWSTNAVAAAWVMGIAAFICGVSSRWGKQSALIVVPLLAAILSVNPSNLHPSDRVIALVAGAIWGAITITLLKVEPSPKGAPVSTLAAAIFAVLLGATIGTATGFVTSHDFPHGYWLTVVLLAVMQPSIADSRQKSLQSVVGTIVGAGVALGIGQLLPNELSTALGFGFLVGWAIYKGNDWIRNAILTVGVIISVGSSEGITETAYTRLGFAVGAGLFVLAMTYVISFVLTSLNRPAHSEH